MFLLHVFSLFHWPSPDSYFQILLPFFLSNFSNCCLLLCSLNTCPSLWFYPPLFLATSFCFSPSFCLHAFSPDIHPNVSDYSSSFLTISFILACQDLECRMEDCMVHKKYFLCWLPLLDYEVGYFIVANTSGESLKGLCPFSRQFRWRTVKRFIIPLQTKHCQSLTSILWIYANICFYNLGKCGWICTRRAITLVWP